MPLDSLKGVAVQEIEPLMLLSTNSRLTVPWFVIWNGLGSRSKTRDQNPGPFFTVIKKALSYASVVYKVISMM